jgi:hypothetical protein
VVESTWKQSDVFPVIARIIETTFQEQQRFVTAQEIAVQLLLDHEGRCLIEAAYEQQEHDHSLEWLASNMVSWFSQRITVGESDWSNRFDRMKVDGFWAYQPAVPN